MYAPKYTITNRILLSMGQIEASKEVIENAPLVPQFEKQFKVDAVLRTVHHGTHIEGNDLNIEQTKKILEGETVFARDRDIQEVINYRNVVGLLDELSKKERYEIEMLTDLQRLSVFRIVADDKIGVFRTTQVVIKNEATGEVILRPPPFNEVPYMVEDFIEWLNFDSSKEIHPILRAGIAHYILVAIHPFIEGNGRAVRAFANLILLREGYDTKRFFALEEHFDSDPASYYEAFAKVDRQSPNIAIRDLTPWLEYFVETVAVELVKIKDTVRKLSADSRIKEKVGKQISLSERQMKLVEYLGETGDAGMKELKNVLPMVSEDTILRDLKDLIRKGIVRKEGSTKASKYVVIGR